MRNFIVFLFVGLIFCSSANAGQVCVDFNDSLRPRIADGLTKGGRLCPGATQQGDPAEWVVNGVVQSNAQCAKRVLAKIIRDEDRNWQEQLVRQSNPEPDTISVS